MAHQVIWTQRVLEAFISEANLTDEEQTIMRMRVAGRNRLQIAFDLSMSLSALDKRIARLKIKYDAAQRTSAILLPRKFAARETFTSEF